MLQIQINSVYNFTESIKTIIAYTSFFTEAADKIELGNKKEIEMAIQKWLRKDVTEIFSPHGGL